MISEKEIEEAATKTNLHFVTNPTRATIADAFEEGAKWAIQTLIEKASEGFEECWRGALHWFGDNDRGEVLRFWAASRLSIMEKAATGFDKYLEKNYPGMQINRIDLHKETWTSARLSMMAENENLSMLLSIQIQMTESREAENKKLREDILSAEKERQSTELFWKLKLQELQDKHEDENEKMRKDLEYVLRKSPASDDKSDWSMEFYQIRQRHGLKEIK